MPFIINSHALTGEKPCINKGFHELLKVKKKKKKKKKHILSSTAISLGSLKVGSCPSDDDSVQKILLSFSA